MRWVMVRFICMTLAKATDELNEVLRDAEDRLAALNLGVAAEIALSDCVHLRFGKHGAGWALLCIRGDQTDPIVSASRRVRVEAAQALPRLRAALLETATTQEAAVRFAVLEARKFLASLR